MGLKEDFLFWKLAYHFISHNEYRLIQISQDHNEVWLEKTEHRAAQVIRLINTNIDWSNWLKNDIERAAYSSEKIRANLMKRSLNVLNIYITPLPPVDDYDFNIKPYTEPRKGKVKVNSLLIESSNILEKLSEVNEIVGGLDAQDFSHQQQDDLEADEIFSYKQAALSAASQKAKKEKAIFNYGKPLLTYFFIGLQVLVFILMEFSGGSTNTSTLIQFGAKFNPLIIDGEWWRFLTPVILHIGIFHLLMNTLALFYLGTLTEKIFGNTRFLFIYLLAGFTGSVASFLVNPNLSAGASGAIFGLFGALLYFGVTFPKLFFRTIGMNIIVVLGLNLAFGFTVPGIDNAGHIGGLIGGFAAAGIVHFPKRKRWFVQTAFFLVSVLGLASLVSYGFSEKAELVDEKSILVLAQHYMQAEEYDQAFFHLKEYQKANEGSADILFLLSYAEVKRENLDEAKAYLYQVIEMNPDFHEAHYNLALVFMDEKNLEEAQIHAEHAVHIKPDKREYKELLQRINFFLE